MWFNDKAATKEFNFTLVSTLYVRFHMFFNKGTPIYFFSRKILLEAAELQNQCISLSIRIYYTHAQHM